MWSIIAEDLPDEGLAIRCRDPFPLVRGYYHLVRLGAVFSPNDNRIAIASYDRTIKLWDAQTAKEQRTLVGHGGQVIRVAFRPDGKSLASASADGTVRLWDVERGTLNRSYPLNQAGFKLAVSNVNQHREIHGQRPRTSMFWQPHYARSTRTRDMAPPCRLRTPLLQGEIRRARDGRDGQLGDYIILFEDEVEWSQIGNLQRDLGHPENEAAGLDDHLPAATTNPLLPLLTGLTLTALQFLLIWGKTYLKIGELLTRRGVSGRPKPASNGRLKTGHLEETTIRQIPWTVYPAFGENRQGASPHYGSHRHHSHLACPRLVAEAHRPRAGHPPRYGRPLFARWRRAGKTGQCAPRLGGRASDVKTGQCAPRLGGRLNRGGGAGLHAEAYPASVRRPGCSLPPPGPPLASLCSREESNSPEREEEEVSPAASPAQSLHLD